MSTAPNWSVEDFAAKLEDRRRARVAATPQPQAERLGYRKAAALLTLFDPTALKLPGGQPPGGAVLQLLDDCVARGAASTPLWSLRPEVRREALKSFSGPEEARRALEANLDLLPASGTERFVLDFLQGRQPDRTGMDAETMSQLREAVGWLWQVPGMTGVPPEQEIEGLLERRRLLEPLYCLMRHRF
jgi:cellulose synthase operon protein C